MMTVTVPSPVTFGSGGAVGAGDANLIETSREGRAVRHSLTALGHTFPGQLPAAGARSG